MIRILYIAFMMLALLLTAIGKTGAVSLCSCHDEVFLFSCSCHAEHPSCSCEQETALSYLQTHGQIEHQCKHRQGFDNEPISPILRAPHSPICLKWQSLSPFNSPYIRSVTNFDTPVSFSKQSQLLLGIAVFGKETPLPLLI